MILLADTNTTIQIMKILVTGGGGMVGRNLQSIMPDAVYPSRLECNLVDSLQTERMFEEYKPDIVIHIAARVAGLNGNINDNYQQLLQNSMINLNVIEFCRLYKVKRLINILSTCVFPDKVEYPLRSEYILDGPPHQSNEGYSTSKRLLYIASKCLSDENNEIEIINLTPTNMYGLHDNYDELTSHVIPSLVRKIIEAKETNTTLKVQGSGCAMRQFVYALDFAKIIKEMSEITLKKKFNNIIVSPPREAEITINQLVVKISKICKFTGFKLKTPGPDGQIKKTCDSMELQKYLPFFEFTPLEDGLQEVVNTCLESKPWEKK